MNSMEISGLVVLIIEIIGTAAFAVSGACAGIQRRLDFFGVVCLALVTAVGGGVIRDVILGRTPPVAFLNPIYVVVGLAAACLVLIVAYFQGNFIEKGTFSSLSLLFKACDAVGLAIFTVVGMNSAIALGHDRNLFLLVFVGMITGVGGGMIRDVLAGTTPLVLRREIYAVASIAGAVLYYILLFYMDQTSAMIAALIGITVIRMAAVLFDLNLPVPAKDQDAEDQK